MTIKNTLFLPAMKMRALGMRWLLLCLICCVAVPAKAQITLILGDKEICEGTTSSLSDPVYGGTWSSGNPSVGTIGVSTGIVTGISAGTTTISYIINTKVITAIVTVDPAPNAGIITGSGSVCAGSTISLSDLAAGGVWSSGSPSVASVSAGGVVTGLSSGTAEISYSVTNSCGTAVASVVISVNAVSAGTISGVSSLCTGSNSLYTNTVAGGSWSSSNGLVATVGAAGLVTAVGTGVATISYAVSNSCGTAYATQNVTVNAAPYAGIIIGVTSLCSGSTVLMSNAMSGGSWSSGSPAIATVDASGLVTGIAAGTATISYSITNVCGSAVATRTVTINPVPDAGTISGAGSVCAGATISLSDAAAGGVWHSSVSSVASVSTSGLVNGLVPGTTTISYTVTNGCGSVYVTKVVTVNATPNAGTISGAGTVCAGSTILLSDAALGGSWNSSMPSVATVSAPGLVTGIAAGTTVISYSVTTVCGSAVATRVITVNPIPNASAISGLTSVCVGSSISLSDIAGGGVWYSSAASVASVGSTGIVTGLATGTTTISYTVTNSCGSATATKVVTVNSTTVAPITGPSTVLTGATITLTDVTPGGTWSASNPNATVTGGVVTGVSAGSVVISYGVTGVCGTVYATKNVVVTAPPVVPPITGYYFDMCVGVTRPYFDAMPGGTWSISPLAVATVSATGVVAGLSAGTATLTYTVGGGYATAIVTVHPVPAPITGNGILCVGDTTTLHDATPGGVWSSGIPAKASVTSTGFVTAINHSEIPPPIYYTIGTFGCRATFVLTINFPPLGIYGPNKVCAGSAVTLHNDSTGGTWSGSNSIATVNATGDVTGLTAGTTHITYTISDGCSRILTMTVNPQPAPISGTLSVCEGRTTFVSDATTPGVSWTSSNPTVASISYSGAVAGVSAGTATITYMAATTCIRTAVVTVHPTPSVSPIIGPSFVSHSGPGITLSDLTPGGVWTSSNNAILSVGSTTGLVIANVSAGSANINYIVTNSAGCSGFATKVISTSPAPPGHGGGTTTNPGSTISFADELTAGEWYSSDNAIAIVDAGGVVTTMAPGVVTITHTTTDIDGKKLANTYNLVVNGLSMDLSLVPNPNKGNFSVRGTTGSGVDEAVTFEIADMSGHILYAASAMAPGGIINEQLMPGNLVSGMYVLNVRTSTTSKGFRFVVE